MSTQMDALVSAHADVSKILRQYGFGPSSHQLEADNHMLQSDLTAINHELPLRSSEEMKNLSSTIREDLDSLTKLLRLRDELAEAKEKLHIAMLTMQSSNLLCPQALEERAAWCSNTIDHLASVSSKRDLLLYYLQQPPPHSCLTMPRQHHREFEELLRGLGEIIKSTCSNISLFERSPDAHLQPALERCISTLSHLHGALRMLLNDISALQQLPRSGSSHLDTEAASPS